MELIGQQPQVSGANPTSGMPERMTGGWWGGLAMKYTKEDLDMGMYRNIATPVFAVLYPNPHAVHDDRWHLSLNLGVNIT